MKGLFSKVFAYDGKLVDFLTTFGQLIILNAVFLVCCIPVVSIGPAISSFYYAIIKSLRRGRGTPLGEFFSSMKRTFIKGSIISAIIELAVLGLYVGYSHITQFDTQTAKIIATAYVLVFAVLILTGIYIFPILSRFEMSISKMWQLAFVMSIRFIPITILLIVGIGLVAWLQVFILPIPCMLFVPGLVCFLSTFVIEKALLYYMPQPKEGDDAWYYAKRNSIKSDESGNKAERGKG